MREEKQKEANQLSKHEHKHIQQFISPVEVYLLKIILWAYTLDTHTIFFRFLCFLCFVQLFHEKQQSNSLNRKVLKCNFMYIMLVLRQRQRRTKKESKFKSCFDNLSQLNLCLSVIQQIVQKI